MNIEKLEDFKDLTSRLTADEIALDEKIESKAQGVLFNFSKSLPIRNMIANIPEEEKLIILTDIVGFSKSSTRKQVYKIYLFQRYIMSQVLTSRFSFTGKIRIHNFVPTGDGCYMVADKCDSEAAINFLIRLVGGIKDVSDDEGVSISIRASALIGSVVPFIDLERHKNFVGEGMNEAARILSGGQSVLEKQYLSENPDKSVSDAKLFSRNSLYLGKGLKEYAASFKDKCSSFVEFSDVSDKHGMKRDITVLQGL